MAWARILVLIFLVSFILSAIISLLVLDELDAAASAQHESYSRRANAPPLIRHSMLPPTPSLVAQHRRRATNSKSYLATLPSRWTDAQLDDFLLHDSMRADDDTVASSQTDAVGVASTATAGQEQLPRAWPSLEEWSAAHEHEEHDAYDEHDEHGDDEHHQYGEDGEDDEEEHADEEDEESSSGNGSGSLPFLGGTTELHGISLWSLLWRGLGIDLNEWNTDISHLNYTFSEPSEQSKQRIAFQQAHQAVKATPAAPQAGAESNATSSSSTMNAGTDGTQQKQQAQSQPQRRTFAQPTVSVLADLYAQHGVTSFVALTGDCTHVRLTLVHAFFERDDTTTNTQGDRRGEGLIEWFIRPAGPLFYPLHSVAQARAAQAPSDSTTSNPLSPFPSTESPEFDLATAMFHTLLGVSNFNTDAFLAAAFPEVMPSAHAHGTRRQQISGDWVLQEFARVPGIIHAQASSNAAGGGCSGRHPSEALPNSDAEAHSGETDWTVVAFEEGNFELDQHANEVDRAQTVLQVFFQPSERAHDLPSLKHFPSAGAFASAGLPDRAVHPSFTRVWSNVPLHTTRTVVALSVVASSLRAYDASGRTRAEATVFYHLRGDKRVFRSVRLTAEKDADGRWEIASTVSTVGPLAQRRGFISQTIALQPFRDDAVVETASENDLAAYQLIASEFNWARGPTQLAGPLVTGTINKWTAAPSSRAHTETSKRRRRQRSGQSRYAPPQPQTVPPFSAAIYSPPTTAQPTHPNATVGSTSSSEWSHAAWITSRKMGGQYGPDVHPLSVHHGESGLLYSLVQAASADHRFVAYAQVPLITTVDASGNYEPIKIVNLGDQTIFTGLAFNRDGTILAVADNHQDIIILQRSKQAASQRLQKVATPATAQESTSTASNPDAPSADTAPKNANAASNIAPADPSAATELPTPASNKTEPSAETPAAPARKHEWEVMMEVNLPAHLKQLSLLSIQIVDVPVPVGDISPLSVPAAGSGDATSSPSSPLAGVVERSTPFLVLLFQGGVLGTMQLRSIGFEVEEVTEGALAPSSSQSTFARHFHHQPIPADSSLLDVFERFVAVHWDLLLVFAVGFLWAILNLPRFMRIGQQVRQQQQQAAVLGQLAPLPPAAAIAAAAAVPLAVVPGPRVGFFRQFLAGANGAVQLNHLANNMAAAPAGPAAPAPVPVARPPQNPRALLNPLLAVPPSVASSSASAAVPSSPMLAAIPEVSSAETSPAVTRTRPTDAQQEPAAATGPASD